MYYRYLHGDEVYNVSIVYECHHYHGQLDLENPESLRLRFFAPEEINLAQDSPPIRSILTQWLEGSGS